MWSALMIRYFRIPNEKKTEDLPCSACFAFFILTLEIKYAAADCISVKAITGLWQY